MVAAENAGRQWIGIDRDEESIVQVRNQLGKLNENSYDCWRDRVLIRADISQRTDEGKEISHYLQHFDALYRKQNGVCNFCWKQYDSPVMEVEHKVPRSKAGTSRKRNLQLLCPRCNKLKGNSSWPEAIAKAKKLGIRKSDSMNPIYLIKQMALGDEDAFEPFKTIASNDSAGRQSLTALANGR